MDVYDFKYGSLARLKSYKLKQFEKESGILV